RLDHVAIAAHGLARPREGRDPPLDHPVGGHSFHLVAVTVVPIPRAETMSNSSISRPTPAKPSPRPPHVEQPPAVARRTSAIPGPLSRATTTTPRRAPFSTAATMISPYVA